MSNEQPTGQPAEKPVRQLPPMTNVLIFAATGLVGLAGALYLLSVKTVDAGEAEWGLVGTVLGNIIGYAVQAVQYYLQGGGRVKLPTMWNIIGTSWMTLAGVGFVLSLQVYGDVNFSAPAWGLIGTVLGGLNNIGGTAIQFYFGDSGEDPAKG